MLENRNNTMEQLNGKKIGILILFAFVGWTICGMIMGIGLSTTTELNSLIIHAALVPGVFFGVSYAYFNKYGFTTPVHTAVIFITFVILMDFFVVSLLINKNFDMFKSFLGTWFVFMEIFATTYLTGTFYHGKSWSLGTITPQNQIN